MEILINGKDKSHLVNGNVNSFYLLMLRVLERSIPAGIDTLKDGIQMVFDLVIEFCETERENKKGGEKAKLTRTMNRIGDQRNYWRKIVDKSIFLQRYYDLILSLEGQGTLPGFGFSNKFGDSLSGNPERDSILKNNALIIKSKN